MAPSADEFAREVLASGYVGQGPMVERFEKELNLLLEVPSGRSVLALNSCTSALDLSLHLIGVGPGDLVISTPMTCMATNTPIVNRGARILWADVDCETGLINYQGVALLVEQYGSRVKAIMAVDWAGSLCDYEALHVFWKPVIQDAAHSILARRGASQATAPEVGGDYVAWSFQAIKHLTTCDGGALLTPESQHARAKLLRWYGLDRESSANFRCSQFPSEAGYKYHLNDFAAAVGVANVGIAQWVVDRHRENAAFYQAELKGCRRLQCPVWDDGSSWWLYCVRTREPEDRDDLIRYLAHNGLAASPVHARNDRMPCFQSACANPDHPLPGVAAFSSCELAVPVGWWLEEADRKKVVWSLKKWDAKRAARDKVVVG